MAVGDLYNLTIYISSTSSSGILVLSYRQSSGANDADTLQSACDFFVANQLLKLRDCLADEVDLNRVDMHSVFGAQEIPGINPIIALPGLRPGDALPFGAAAVATKITDAPNAKFNGRYYLPGISETDQTDGKLETAILALLVLWNVEVERDLLTSSPQDAVFKPVVISRFENGVPRINPVAFDIVSTVQRINLKQQRRRITQEVGFSG